MMFDRTNTQTKNEFQNLLKYHAVKIQCPPFNPKLCAQSFIVRRENWADEKLEKRFVHYACRMIREHWANQAKIELFFF